MAVRPATRQEPAGERSPRFGTIHADTLACGELTCG
jgi:hypothetical protein